MPFKVKATVVAWLGDEETYPCHFQHSIGDEFIYDGEKFIGRICPSMSSLVIQPMIGMHAAGPRFMPRPGYYYPFWYAPVSRKDPSLKKFDGLGFRNVLETAVESKYHMANLQPANAFKWPPHGERTVARAPMVVCPDVRTSMLMELEAFDLSDKGYDVPFFRREMIILKKVLEKAGVPTGKILDEFDREESENIYPALSQIMIETLSEELELMGYLQIEDGRASVTKRGELRLEEFKTSLTSEERKALRI